MTADKVIEIALNEVGYKESPANSNKTKYGEAYGWNGVSWCVIFAWWCFREAGMSSLFYGGGKVSSCSQYRAYAQQNGEWVTGDYQRGDMVIFDFPNTAYVTDHIGIVTAVTKDGVVTIEGNTSATGSQSNGGMVMQKTRPLSQIIGAVRTKYIEEYDMYLERFKQLYAEMRKELQDNDSSAYSEAARQWAVSTGLIQGGNTLPNGEPNYMWADLMTREQFVTVLHRFAEMAGLV